MEQIIQADTSVVPIRHMAFDFDESKAAKYCWNNNAWGSAFILTFSALIPAGERFVIDAVREFRDQVNDPELKARATGLIGQEATHSRVHAEFNEMYDLKGLPINHLVALSEKIYLKRLLPHLPKKTTLAMACGIEHVTALMADDTFGKHPERQALLDEVARDFLAWHLLEELEHKSVAFDLYEAVGGGYWHRIFAFLLIWSVSVPIGLYGVNKILKTPGFSQGARINREGAIYHLKFFLSNSKNFWAYFRKDFHPNNIDNTEVLTKWRESLFGQNGTLSKHVTKTIFPKANSQALKA